ncbi:LysR family transcriptional regulator [Alloyangia pacifica]|uniref:LysR family transcriptional regulator n=1 Tax=Alloyangia pacifica TaxID=311180 RepID=UPI001CD28E14|nr:LysR substrate-binding domain-containing protein [Alloyangia pacifica]MCA0995057.1 LysR family transcriptional regulator [Alloyangia pacifica]
MELRHLRYFTVLAEELHFGRAAARLNIVQPALSMQIRALEEELGATLFLRERRQVSLSPAGAQFLPEARRVLAQAEFAAQVARDAARGVIGHLRLGFSANAVFSGVLSDVVARMREAHPKVEITPVEGHPTELTEALLRGELDAAVSTVLSGPVHDGLRSRKLAAFAPRLVVPKGSDLAARGPVAPKALRAEAFIGYSGSGDVDGMGLTAQVLGFMPRLACTSSSPSMAIGLVAAGFGLTVVPESLALPGQGVDFVPLVGAAEVLDVSVIWPEAQAGTGVTGAFLDLLHGG